MLMDYLGRTGSSKKLARGKLTAINIVSAHKKFKKICWKFMWIQNYILFVGLKLSSKKNFARLFCYGHQNKFLYPSIISSIKKNN